MRPNVDGVNMASARYSPGMGNRRETAPYHHGDLRAALLAAAAELLDEGGPEAVSLRECARRAGVSHAAPYRHFDTKEALLVALADEGFDALADAGEKAMNEIPASRASDRLDAYGIAYVRFAIAHPARFRLMFAAALGIPAAPGKVDGAVKGGRAYEQLRECVRAVVGEVDDLDAAAAAFWALPHGLAMLILDGRIPKARVPNARAVDELARASFAYWRQPRQPLSAFHIARTRSKR